MTLWLSLSTYYGWTVPLSTTRPHSSSGQCLISDLKRNSRTSQCYRLSTLRLQPESVVLKTEATQFWVPSSRSVTRCLVVRPSLEAVRSPLSPPQIPSSWLNNRQPGYASQSIIRYSAFQPVTAPTSTSAEQQTAVHLEGSTIPCLDAPNWTPSTGLDSSASVPPVPVPIRRRRLVQRPGTSRREGASKVLAWLML
ncbi:hypothetical protein DER46DRAFT_568375 [Fusarium sp. MPI-SDFR-AT-0072]|nr:hypothetical protein DER46DRAFT_568375 [Fusarium sp. MPI-SDFR-AT-0072]